MVLPVQGALRLHSRRLTAYETVGSYVDGRFVEGAPQPNFTFHGSMQPATDKDLAFLPEGNISDGTKVLQTRRELFIADTTQDATVLRQTYVLLDGETWRVVAVADWSIHSLIRRYLCTKFFELTP